MGRPVFIIHFQPLELYPPVMNLVNYIKSYDEDFSVIILSTHSTNPGIDTFKAGSKKISIIRPCKSGTALPAMIRYLNYIYFYACSLFLLMLRRPRAILYYETLSSYPAYLYKKYFSADIPLYIHYHEYTSPAEYMTGMKLVKYFNKKEKKLYHKAAWISHTNEERLSRFLADERLESGHNTFILPNYPSELWQHKPALLDDESIKIVYAGAVSMDTMYTESFANWVQSKNGKLLWDIYSNNITENARTFLGKINSPFIRLLNGVNYNELQKILPGYNVGVILYNGHIPNYVFNAPNKLFEYLACGLDVWHPGVMIGCLRYNTAGTYPAVISLDFTNPDSFDIDRLVARQGYPYKPSEYFYENIYPGLVQKMVNSAG
jgi:hypothetical protein